MATPLEAYPAWADHDVAAAAESAVDWLIADYSRQSDWIPQPQSYDRLVSIATNVMAALYASIEAQVEIAINAEAYRA